MNVGATLYVEKGTRLLGEGDGYHKNEGDGKGEEVAHRQG